MTRGIFFVIMELACNKVDIVYIALRLSFQMKGKGHGIVELFRRKLEP